MNKTRKRIAILLIVSLLAPFLFSLIPGIGALTSKEVSAAANQAKLDSTKIEVGVNSSPQFIYIDNYNSSAVYTYKSENEKIATVTEYGTVQGVKLGNTKVVVTESINGVDTVLGSVPVSVLEAYLDKELKVGLSSGFYINVNCSNMDATFTFKSSDTKVAKVNKYGSVTGVKLGATSISVTQKLNGKTTKLGSIKVKVVNSELYDNVMEVPVSEYSYGQIYLNYFNTKAIYSYKSNNTKIAKVDKNGNVTGVKLGTAKITVKETYNKKTITVGTITVKVKGASLYEDSTSYEMGINTVYYLTDLVGIKLMDYNAYYYAKSEDNKIVKVSEGEDYGIKYCKINAVGLGTTNLTIYEEKNGKSKKLGSITLTVKEFPIQSLGFYNDYPEVIDGMPTITLEYSVDNSWNNMKDYLNIAPYNTTTPFTFTSSDEAVVTIDKSGYITTMGAGSATLAATCGAFSATLKVNVTAISATSLKFDAYYFNDDKGSLSVNYSLATDYSYYTLKDYLLVEPNNVTEKIVYTSSDEKIIKVDQYGYITPVAKGTATLTVTSGKLSTSLKVNVE